jgi:hypothetical protein
MPRLRQGEGEENMRDLNKTIEHIERVTWKQEDRRPTDVAKLKPSPRAWRAPDAVLRPASAAEREVHRQASGGAAGNTVVARAVKVTIPLQPDSVAALAVPESGPARVKLSVSFDAGTLRTEIAAKSVRKAQRVLAENGPDAVFCMLQGKLAPKNEIVECGLVAQVKATA